MTREMKDKLGRLQDIARMKSDQSITALAEVTAEIEALRRNLAALDEGRTHALRSAGSLREVELATRYAAGRLERRRAILAAIARAELRRQSARDAARSDEGRRQTLERISGILGTG
ncbi:hypothetical protein HKCCE2091_13490 [Rhodobacterales bacterium HKCCE2091]|nr:hypothetical protein [Rhodobacterales bacterium HKCCE2091]